MSARVSNVLKLTYMYRGFVKNNVSPIECLNFRVARFETRVQLFSTNQNASDSQSLSKSNLSLKTDKKVYIKKMKIRKAGNVGVTISDSRLTHTEVFCFQRLCPKGTIPHR